MSCRLIRSIGPPFAPSTMTAPSTARHVSRYARAGGKGKGKGKGKRSWGEGKVEGERPWGACGKEVTDVLMM